MPAMNGRDIGRHPYADTVMAIIREVRARARRRRRLGRDCATTRDGRSMFSKNLLVRTYKHLRQTGRLSSTSRPWRACK
jgi:hypothetical protein